LFHSRSHPPPLSTLFPYTTLFRSVLRLLARVRGVLGDPSGALEAAERLRAVDPGLDESHYLAALSLAELGRGDQATAAEALYLRDRKSTRLNSSHEWISYAVFCLK